MNTQTQRHVKWRRGVPPGTLSPRRRQVITLAAYGLSNDAIGLRLELSHATVRNHVYYAMDYYGVHDRTALVVAWLRDPREHGGAPALRPDVLPPLPPEHGT